MRLGLKTDSNITTLALLNQNGRAVVEESWESGRQLSDQLLTKISQLLSSHNLEWKDLTGIIVFKGPGSFTGLRIGVTVANTIAYAQALPIVGQSGSDWLSEGHRRLIAGDNEVQVVPDYGARPNITKPRPKLDHSR
jgi:tRNA threonylcarbamoyladenosine biosynthesis protein TsaB